MSYAMRLDHHGDATAFKKVTTNIAVPTGEMVTVKHHAIGLNYIDIYHRTGLYPVNLPGIIGLEAAGEIIATGPDVTNFSIGARVAYASPPLGAYSDVRQMPASRLVKLPPSISYETAAAMMLQGMTVEYLIRQTYKVKADDTVLFHAAAGGVGLLACQWLKRLGATVIGTVGSPEKAELAKAHGCDHTIQYRHQDVVKIVKDITDGKGVAVVYDSIGADTYEISLNCLRPRGYFVSFGNASGALSTLKVSDLTSRGSLFFTRPSLMDYTADPQSLAASASSLFAVYEAGMKININQSYPLIEVSKAHQQLERRQTTGASILIP